MWIATHEGKVEVSNADNEVAETPDAEPETPDAEPETDDDIQSAANDEDVQGADTDRVESPDEATNGVGEAAKEESEKVDSDAS